MAEKMKNTTSQILSIDSEMRAFKISTDNKIKSLKEQLKKEHQSKVGLDSAMKSVLRKQKSEQTQFEVKCLPTHMCMLWAMCGA